MENSDFSLILNTNESILKTYKPRKLKMYFSVFFVSVIIYAWILVNTALATFLANDEEEALPLVAFIVIVCVVVLAILLEVIFVEMAYKKRMYCVTNQRLIIRCGVVGVDFKSLDLVSIGATDVYVSFIDKIARKNTGTLRFGNMSSPISNGAGMFSFAHVERPYELYKEIKQIIDEAKSDKEN